MKKYKKILWLIMPLILFVILLSLLIKPVSISASEGDEALTVGIPIDRCPMFYQDSKTKDLVGIGVDLMKKAAQNAGYKATFVQIKEKSLKEALDNPEYDVVMPFGSTLNSAAGKTSITTENLIQTPFTLVTLGNVEIKNLDILNIGMLVSLASVAETVKQMYPGIEITLYDNMEDCVNNLRKGKVDALLHNSYVWSYVLQKPSYSDLHIQPSSMFSMDFRAGTLDTTKGREIVERLNVGIAQLTDTYRQSVTLDYTTRKLYQYTVSDFFYQYWLIIVLIILIVILVITVTILKIRSMHLKHEKKLRDLVDKDPLTGVWSMSGFKKRVEDILRLHPETPYYISYANIKNFKYINDSLGMAAGDELLRFWAAREMSTLSEDEAMGRITADRFVILRHNNGDDRLKVVDNEVLGPVRNYFIDRGNENRVLICGGFYAVTPQDHQQINIDHMIDCARLAEKKVRTTRNEGYDFYNPTQWNLGKKTSEVINYLPNAIKTGGILVFYQPQVDYKQKKIIGAEALCRWEHDKLGFLNPGEFISILEETGYIYDLDSFVWEKVCQDLHRWNEQGIHRSISVNMSRADIKEERDIPSQFMGLIEKYNLSMDQLRIEITESAFAENPEMFINTTIKLRELGFQVEMDDFGSGYSSLHMLKEVPVDRIKLDLHFLTSSGDLNKSHTIVSCIIQMVNLLNMKMIAEGVETIEQANFLLERGCSDMQGYYFFKPMPVEQFEALSEDITDK